MQHTTAASHILPVTFRAIGTERFSSSSRGTTRPLAASNSQKTFNGQKLLVSSEQNDSCPASVVANRGQDDEEEAGAQRHDVTGSSCWPSVGVMTVEEVDDDMVNDTDSEGFSNGGSSCSGGELEHPLVLMKGAKVGFFWPIHF